ncbi:hypothetical protein B7463_g4526, partial [Scytalidium lignicola]
MLSFLTTAKYDTASAMMPEELPTETIKVADYLLQRLLQLGIRSIFGVPGDYNLRLLDFVSPAGLHWVGNCNELNAAYTADAYARINGLGALITTFGVGELSAINGIAGSYTEKVPVIHIIGSPAREFQEARAIMHHTLADGNFRTFAAMSANVTVAQANLIDPRIIPDQIDWILQQALVHSRPVSIELPEDIFDVIVSSSNLKSKKVAIPSAPSPENEPLVLEQVLECIYTTKQPMIIVDGESRALGILNEIDTVVKKTGWPTWTTLFAKGLVNEQLPNVYGTFTGAIDNLKHQEYFDSADLIMTFGPHYSDTNSQRYRSIPKASATLTFSFNTVKIGDTIYRDIPQSFLSQLLQKLDRTRIPRAVGPPKPDSEPLKLNANDPIVQKHLYHVLNPLIRPNDIILAEVGTAALGSRLFKLPETVRTFSLATWMSIGYMLPASLGAALAAREQNKDGKHRVILFVGDGSFQLSVQEVSIIIKEKLDVIMLIINNEGYTVERALHGRKQHYNDITSWKHSQTLSYFGADEEDSKNNYFAARTWRELNAALADKRIQEGNGLRIIEIFTGKEDVEGPLLFLMKKQISEEK